MGKLSSYLPGFASYMETSTPLLPTTRTRYLYLVRKLATYWEDALLSRVKPADILMWTQQLHDRGESASNVQQKFAALRCFLSYCADFAEEENAERLLRALRKVRIRASRTAVYPASAVSKDAMLALVAAARAGPPRLGVRDAALVQFLWDTGVRRAEAASVRLDDVDLEQRSARVVGKGDKERLVLFTADCTRLLRAWITERLTWEPEEGVETLFLSTLGKPLSPQTVWSIVKQLAARAGVKERVYTHGFRHARISHLLSRGMALPDVSKLVGHTDPRTTLEYFHPVTSELRQGYDLAEREPRGRGKGKGREGGEVQQVRRGPLT